MQWRQSDDSLDEVRWWSQPLSFYLRMMLDLPASLLPNAESSCCSSLPLVLLSSLLSALPHSLVGPGAGGVQGAAMLTSGEMADLKKKSSTRSRAYIRPRKNGVLLLAGLCATRDTLRLFHGPIYPTYSWLIGTLTCTQQRTTLG